MRKSKQYTRIVSLLSLLPALLNCHIAELPLESRVWRGGHLDQSNEARGVGEVIKGDSHPHVAGAEPEEAADAEYEGDV